MTLQHDDEVPDYWRSLGLPGLADIHVHFLPERMLRKVWAFFDSVGEGDSGQARWPIHYRYDEATRLDVARRLGLVAVPALAYPHKPGMAGWLNEWCGEFAARVPDAIRCATFFPEDGVGGYVAAAVADGARLFKMHVQVGGFDPTDPVLAPAWEVLQENGIPVVIHCGSGPHAGRFTGVGPIRRLLTRFPRLSLVIAHGGLPEYLEFAALAADSENVRLDTTMLATDYMNAIAPLPAGYPQRLAELQHKVVLGSDFPNIPYPYAHQIESLRRLDLGDDWMRSVLWRNGARLLGLLVDVDRIRSLTTARLRLDALRVDDAAEMTAVLSSRELYEFIGGEAPDEANLRRRYQSQTAGSSPDGSQDWLNWIVRIGSSGAAVGYTQASIDRRTATGELSWVIGIDWQGRGYAVEAARAMAEALRAAGTRRLIAHVHPEHGASQRVAAAAGMVATDRTLDGEVEWEWRRSPDVSPG